ncbi:glycoside hydrolase family 3 C-terminal domain-containing protein [bacterium]|nr:glycoside hydrolase family 3 C-terminal domain-containing protein [bacterium]
MANCPAILCTPGTAMADETPAYLNPDLSPADRARDLCGRMTLAEKVSQMVHDAFAIPRLGVPAYNWWNECLHGVGRAGVATVFPQAIGLAATFDADLVFRVATAISDEARAKHHAALSADGGSLWYYGLTFWTPNINLFRDPRWGRGQETYGECPYLAALLGVAFVKGLQGDDPHYLKLVATPKHFAVHSGPEAERHGFDAVVSPRDLRESYLPHFRAVVEAGAGSIMSAYNRVNGEACSASPEEAAALSVKAGCDLNCGCTYGALTGAVEQGLISEAELDVSLQRLLEARFRLGMFDPPERVPYAGIPLEVNDCAAHRALALLAAQESIVLLKNDGVLPLAADVKRLAVIGPNADDVSVLLGNYNGEPSAAVTPLQGIMRRAGESVAVSYARGCDLVGEDRSGFAQAVALAAEADVVVMVLGLSPRLEGEEGDSDLNRSGDRTYIDLPPIQEALLREVAAVGKPVVLVLLSGSAIAVNWAEEHVNAILATWYGGEEAGTALAEVLWGDVSPAGRLPVTFYRSLDQLPAFSDYGMAGRTYRFSEAETLYRFGYGLSYTRFAYGDLTVTPHKARTGEQVVLGATVTNVGDRPGDEVVQLYVTDLEATVAVPLRQLQGCQRVHLQPGEQRQVSFTLRPEQLVCYSEAGEPMLEPGEFLLAIGGGQPGPGATGSFVTGVLRLT